MQNKSSVKDVWGNCLISAATNHGVRTHNSQHFLQDNGFTFACTVEDIIGKTVALELAAFHFDFLSYKVQDIVIQEHGVQIIPNSGEVRFYKHIGDKLCFFTQPVSNFELFITSMYISPSHYMPLFVGDDFIGAAKTEDEFAIGWKYPPKTYLSEEQIREQEPDLSARIDAKLAACRMDVSGLVEQLQSAACEHGIEVEVEYRTKTFASCYANIKRIQQHARPRVPEFIYDINGIRLLPKTPDECYALLEIAHGLVEFDDIRDLILFPKSNCFQGLICRAKDSNLSLEVQIQTPHMKQVAETVAGNYRNGYSL